MDRRSLKRQHLIYFLRVFQINNGQLLGHLVDISKKGIMLVGETALLENTDYAMKMLLPFTINEKKELLLKGRCIYSKPDVNPNFFSSGFELIDTSDEVVAEAIDRLIKQYGFNE